MRAILILFLVLFASWASAAPVREVPLAMPERMLGQFIPGGGGATGAPLSAQYWLLAADGQLANAVVVNNISSLESAIGHSFVSEFSDLSDTSAVTWGANARSDCTGANGGKLTISGGAVICSDDVGGGSGGVTQLSADQGIALPSSGDITIVGGTNVTTAASGNQVTINASGGGDGGLLNSLRGDTGASTTEADVPVITAPNNVLETFSTTTNVQLLIKPLSTGFAWVGDANNQPLAQDVVLQSELSTDLVQRDTNLCPAGTEAGDEIVTWADPNGLVSCGIAGSKATLNRTTGDLMTPGNIGGGGYVGGTHLTMARGDDVSGLDCWAAENDPNYSELANTYTILDSQAAGGDNQVTARHCKNGRTQFTWGANGNSWAYPNGFSVGNALSFLHGDMLNGRLRIGRFISGTADANNPIAPDPLKFQNETSDDGISLRDPFATGDLDTWVFGGAAPAVPGGVAGGQFWVGASGNTASDAYGVVGAHDFAWNDPNNPPIRPTFMGSFETSPANSNYGRIAKADLGYEKACATFNTGSNQAGIDAAVLDAVARTKYKVVAVSCWGETGSSTTIDIVHAGGGATTAIGTGLVCDDTQNGNHYCTSTENGRAGSDFAANGCVTTGMYDEEAAGHLDAFGDVLVMDIVTSTPSNDVDYGVCVWGRPISGGLTGL